MRLRDFLADGETQAGAMVTPMGATPETCERLQELL
jgi:hypothetical protein